jgi:Domain of unknown function (DUF4440)
VNSLTLDQLLECEHAGWESLCESRGGAFYQQLMLPEGLMVLVNGMVLDRTGVARSLVDAPPWQSYRISDARAVPISSDSAALLYRAEADRGDGEPFEALMSSVYRLVDGDLRLLLHQQTAQSG